MYAVSLGLMIVAAIVFLLMFIFYVRFTPKMALIIVLTGLAFMLKSLKTFANNGRVSPLLAKAIGVLGICIVGKASDEGTLEPLHKCRGEKRSLETLADVLCEEGFAGGKVSIGHCQNEEGAEQLKTLIIAKHPQASVEIHKLKGLCSFYAEMGGILVGFEKA